MYKYISNGGRSESPSQVRKNRIRTGVTIVLLLALIGLTIYNANAVIYRNASQELIPAYMRSECNSAISQVNSLSRTAGASSSAVLGKIRGHVYSMETLNEMYTALNSRELIPHEVFDRIYQLLDDYADKLITGMTTGDMQSLLLSEVQGLMGYINILD